MVERTITLADAVKVLNRHRHRGFEQWVVSATGDAAEPADSVDRYSTLEAFEAVAVAEKYLQIQGTAPFDLSSPSTH